MPKEVKLLRLVIGFSSIRTRDITLYARREDYKTSFNKVYKIISQEDRETSTQCWEKLVKPEQLMKVDSGFYNVSSEHFQYNIWCLEPDFEAAQKLLKEKCNSKLTEMHQTVNRMKEQWDKFYN
jgi:hypothetical protein